LKREKRATYKYKMIKNYKKEAKLKFTPFVFGT
jgi:hypothetical protein